MDLDEFLFSKNNINILEYLKKNKDIGKITIKQKKFVDRFLIKNNLVTQDFRCIENINTNGWGIKHIVKISDIVKIGDMHNIDTKSKTININENILRFNHYNVNKKQLDWMKGFYKINKEFTLNGYDDSMKRYAYLFNNLNF